MRVWLWLVCSAVWADVSRCEMFFRKRTALHIYLVMIHNLLNYTVEKALLGFEPRISCLLDRRFNQLSHSALWCTIGTHSEQCPDCLFVGTTHSKNQRCPLYNDRKQGKQLILTYKKFEPASVSDFCLIRKSLSSAWKYSSLQGLQLSIYDRNHTTVPVPNPPLELCLFKFWYKTSADSRKGTAGIWTQDLLFTRQAL